MASSQTNNRLTVDGIRRILAQVPQIKKKTAAQLSAEEEALLQRYQYLMDVYCIVKSGGVQVQLEACQQAMLGQQREIKAEHLDKFGHCQDSALLAQELSDLDRATRWRMNRLEAIHATEEAAVRTGLAEIEASFQRNF